MNLRGRLGGITGVASTCAAVVGGLLVAGIAITPIGAGALGVLTLIGVAASFYLADNAGGGFLKNFGAGVLCGATSIIIGGAVLVDIALASMNANPGLTSGVLEGLDKLATVITPSNADQRQEQGAKNPPNINIDREEKAAHDGHQQEIELAQPEIKHDNQKDAPNPEFEAPAHFWAKPQQKAEDQPPPSYEDAMKEDPIKNDRRLNR